MIWIRQRLQWPDMIRHGYVRYRSRGDDRRRALAAATWVVTGWNLPRLYLKHRNWR